MSHRSSPLLAPVTLPARSPAPPGAGVGVGGLDASSAAVPSSVSSSSSASSSAFAPIGAFVPQTVQTPTASDIAAIALSVASAVSPAHRPVGAGSGHHAASASISAPTATATGEEWASPRDAEVDHTPIAHWEPQRDEVRGGAGAAGGKWKQQPTLQAQRPHSTSGQCSASHSKSRVSSGTGAVTQLPPRHSNDAFHTPGAHTPRYVSDRQRELELEHELQALGEAQLDRDAAWPAELHPSSSSRSNSETSSQDPNTNTPPMFVEGLAKRRAAAAVAAAGAASSPSIKSRARLGLDHPLDRDSPSSGNGHGYGVASPATLKQQHHQTYHQNNLSGSETSRCSCSRSRSSNNRTGGGARASPDSDGELGSFDRLSHSLSRPPSRRSSDAQLRPYLAAGDDEKERSRSSQILDPLNQARFQSNYRPGSGSGGAVAPASDDSETEHEDGCPQKLLMKAGMEDPGSANSAPSSDPAAVPLLAPVPLSSDSRKRFRIAAALHASTVQVAKQTSGSGVGGGGEGLGSANQSRTLSAYLASYYLQLTSGELLRALCTLFAAYMLVVIIVLSLPWGMKDPLVFPWWTPTIAMLCVVAMHLMKLVWNVSALKGREKIILSCLCVNCICCVSYGANALGLVHIYMDAHGRRFLSTRFLEWICATPLLVLLIANLSDFMFRADKSMIQILPLRLLIPNGPRYERVQWVVAADVCMLVCGALGGLVPHRGASLFCIVASCGFFLVTMNGLDAFLSHTQSCCQWLVDLSVQFKESAIMSTERTNPQSRSVQLALMRAPAFTAQQEQNVRILRLLRAWVLCTWSVFPFVYALAETHMISDFMEESLYFFGDLVAKVLLSAAMQSLNLGALDASTEVRSLVEQESHNEAHRQRRILAQRQGIMEMDANEKDNFLRYVFHEIRIPLNSLILGVLDLSSQPLLEPAILDTVRMMSQAASYIPHLLDDVLSLQKITSGKYVLECHAGSLQQMVLAAMSMMASAINQKQLHIAYYLDPHLPLLCTDFHLLRQVCANFLSNALKFTRPDSRLTITVKRVPPPHEQHQMRRLAPSADKVVGGEPKQLKAPLSMRPKNQADSNVNSNAAATAGGGDAPPPPPPPPSDGPERALSGGSVASESGRSSVSLHSLGESASDASMPSEGASAPSGASGVSGSTLPNQQKLHHVEGGRYADVESMDAQEVPAPTVHSFATPCTRCNRLVASTRMCVCAGSQLELPPPSDSPEPLMLPVVWPSETAGVASVLRTSVFCSILSFKLTPRKPKEEKVPVWV